MLFSLECLLGYHVMFLQSIVLYIPHWLGVFLCSSKFFGVYFRVRIQLSRFRTTRTSSELTRVSVSYFVARLASLLLHFFTNVHLVVDLVHWAVYELKRFTFIHKDNCFVFSNFIYVLHVRRFGCVAWQSFFGDKIHLLYIILIFICVSYSSACLVVQRIVMLFSNSFVNVRIRTWSSPSSTSFAPHCL